MFQKMPCSTRTSEAVKDDRIWIRAVQTIISPVSVVNLKHVFHKEWGEESRVHSRRTGVVAPGFLQRTRDQKTT